MSARPRPVTATVGAARYENFLSAQRRYSLSSGSSTTSLVSVLDHDSYESPLSEDEHKVPAFSHETQSKPSIGDGFQCSFKEANKNKNDHLSPWESWLLRKVCEERKRNEEAIAKKAKEEEDKKEVARLKSAKMQESQQKFYNWVEKKNLETELRRKLRIEENRRKKEIKEFQKADNRTQSQEKYEKWLEKKCVEEQERQKAAQEQKTKESEERLARKQKARESFEKWCETARSRGRSVQRSYAYSSGQLTCYFDKAAYPQPAFYNPIPWQPVEVPFDGRPCKSGKRRQTD